MRKLFVLLTAVAFVFAFTAPVFSAEWSFYGSSRMSTFWNDFDDDDPTVNTFDDEDLTWSQQGNSRIGANVKVSDTISGRFEYGDFSLRLLYGEWDFGAGKLLVGQTYGPVNMFMSNQVFGGDSDLLNSGGLYGGRNEMLRFRFGNLDIGLLEPNSPGGIIGGTAASSGFQGTATAVGTNQTNLGATADGTSNFVLTDASGIQGVETDTSIPKLEARYLLSMGALSLELGAGYNTYDEVNTANDREYDIDSWVVALGLKYSMGPAYFRGNIWVGENPTDYGLWVNGDGNASYDAALDVIVDNESVGWVAVVGFKMNDMLSFEAGYGALEHELDDNAVATTEDETQSYYIQAVISPAKGVFIIPELGVLDNEDGPGAAPDPEGKTTYFGAKWQINF